MWQQGYQYSKIVTKYMFSPTFILISVGITFFTAITGSVFFGYETTIQFTSILLSTILIAQLEWKDRRYLDTCYFTKVRHGKKRREKISMVVIEEMIGYLWYILLMFAAIAIVILSLNSSGFMGTLFTNNSKYKLMWSRLDVIGWLYIFSMEYFFLTALYAIVARVFKTPKTYYLIIIMSVLITLVFTGLFTRPFTVPVMIDGKMTMVVEGMDPTSGDSSGTLTGLFTGSPFEWLVLINPQTHINHMMAHEVFKMTEKWVPIDLTETGEYIYGWSPKLTDTEAKMLLAYGYSTEWAVTIFYPLAVVLVLKLAELRTVF